MKTKLSWSLGLSLCVAIAAWASAPPNLGRALDAQRALVAQDPANASAAVDLGNLLLLDGKTAEAEAQYRRSIELDADNVGAHFNLGLLLQERGDGFAALRSYRRVLKLDRDHAWAQYQIGVLHDGWNLKGAAIDAYARALALDPRLSFADVNPHVIENRYLTEAMLRAHRHQGNAAQLPQVYAEPQRIAGLLLRGAPPPAAATAGRPGVDAAAQPGATGAPDAGTATRIDSASQPTRVIGSEDLRGSAAGQATPLESARMSGRAAVPYQPEQYEPPVFQINAPGEEEGKPGSVGMPYYPGAESSGRLEMRVREPGDESTLG